MPGNLAEQPCARLPLAVFQFKKLFLRNLQKLRQLRPRHTGGLAHLLDFFDALKQDRLFLDRIDQDRQAVIFLYGTYPGFSGDSRIPVNAVNLIAIRKNVFPAAVIVKGSSRLLIPRQQRIKNPDFLFIVRFKAVNLYSVMFAI